MCNLGRGHHEVHFCEIILDLDKWLRCRLKDFLSGALADLLFGEAEPLAGIIGNNPVIFFNYFKFEPVVQEGMSFNEKVHRQTDAGRRVITIAHCEPSARVSKNKMRY